MSLSPESLEAIRESVTKAPRLSPTQLDAIVLTLAPLGGDSIARKPSR
jgi:hypothetical protein